MKGKLRCVLPVLKFMEQSCDGRLQDSTNTAIQVWATLRLV